jgi:Ni,Fe-hydrogenase III small subunit
MDIADEIRHDQLVAVSDPKDAEILFVAGPVNNLGLTLIKNVYRKMREPAKIIFLGNCSQNAWLNKKAEKKRDLFAQQFPHCTFVSGCPVELDHLDFQFLFSSPLP